MLSSMFEDVIEVNTGHSFPSKQKQPEQQEQRIWEIDSDEEKEEKKRAKNKRKYLRKKEKAQAEKAELQQQKLDENDTVSSGLAGMSIQDTPTVSTDEHESISGDINTANSAQPKLSKRQKKTLLKKTKQAQTASPLPELVHSSSADNSTSESSHSKPRASKDDESDKENKASGIGHENQDDKSGGGEDEVATESEVEAVMETIAKRFGQ